MPALLDLAASAARHAAARQAVISTNVVNADTPGFRAMDVEPFSPDIGAMTMRRTHPGHLGAGDGVVRQTPIQGIADDPNGNGVTLEDQILRGIEAQRAHNRAVTVYSNALDMLRAGLGRR
ncbi:MAG: flagellar basal body protein [Pseudomonadota bacterium]